MESVTRRLVSSFVWTVIIVSAASHPAKTVSAAVSHVMSNTSDIAAIEAEALMHIRASFLHSEKLLISWIPGESPCGFQSLYCLDGSVSSIRITDLNLAGTLSPYLGNLTNLEYLILRNIGISGSITFGIWRLQKLKTLDLSHNFLVGQVPRNLSYLPNLRSLDLSNNNLIGPMPKLHPSPRPHIVPIGPPPSNQVSPPPRGNSIKTALAVVIAVVCLAMPC